MADTYKIFPAIGVARVGTSQEYYLAPETSGGLPILPGGGDFQSTDFRDSSGELRRQGARFRVYRYPEAGGPPVEVLPGQNGVARIEWTVHLANKKSAWYKFDPVSGTGVYPPPPEAELRNSSVTGDARTALITDAGPRTLTDAGQSATFDAASAPDGYTATFPPALEPWTITSLGEIHTEATTGRLIVVGGFGHSGTDQAYPPATDLNYANNDNWWDDTSDGSVTATIVFTDTATPSVSPDPAWVAVPPPAYAPEVIAQISMYDVIFDVAVRKGYYPDIYENGAYKTGAGGYIPQFDTEIKPLLDRALAYGGVSDPHGNCHVFDYESLGDPNGNANSRQNLRDMMRTIDQASDHGPGAGLMPMLAGDVSASDTDLSSAYVTYTATQIFFADQWAAGYFTSGGTLPDDEAELLTRAALDNCSGAAFAPGIEMTWFSRRPEIYSEPFRLNHRTFTPPLSTDATDLAEGLEPGDFIKFMAIPWQADFNECAVQGIEGKNVNWWPAQRPLKMIRQGETQAQPWVGQDTNSGDGSTYLRFEFNTDMVDHWQELGFGMNTAEGFVEVERLYTDPVADSKRPSKGRPQNRSRRR